MSIKNQIETKRKELIIIAKEHGLSSKHTLRCSEELDKLILLYQQKDLH
ncbi:aspartyl-phosphate phosphatase Spo0E family protein [Evansella tamaricis]|uniref:Aspartyl-phosphate phosphatase Spo0E family protein n=1 Tax=Evansella tamaricis TaxID=2069301 RepID=A0ABS6JDN2_9BACI|nr:aspartyl-phosphate phosphatase Spo0E family protein [Evansella tamaricis]MBU9711309.1 aspartyl-phosphate phosphatase Spo0E family protein [Evansella tamaricis]